MKLLSACLITLDKWGHADEQNEISENILEYSMKCIIITSNNILNLHGQEHP